MKSIAVVNMKGGVGKTSTVVALAEAIAEAGLRALVIDADTQATASYCLIRDSDLKQLIDSKKTVDEFLIKKLVHGDLHARLSAYVRAQSSNLTVRGQLVSVGLVASSNALRLAERDLVYELSKPPRHLNYVQVEQKIEDVFRYELDVMSNNYDIALIDCAPGLSPLSAAAVSVADLILAPTVPDPPSVFGLEAFIRTLRLPPHRPVPRVVITRLAPKKMRLWIGRVRPTDVHGDNVKRIKQRAEEESTFEVLRTTISESTAMPNAMGLAQAPTADAPTFLQKYPGKLGDEIKNLRDEIREILHV